MAVTLSQTAKDLVRTKFIGKDWDTFVAEINSFALTVFGPDVYNAFVAEDEGQMFIESVAYGLQALAWFSDREVGECNPETAIIPENVARLARYIGYRAKGAVPATGQIQVTIISPVAFPVQIVKGSQLISSSGAIYETAETVTFLAGEVGPKNIAIVEGETIEEVFYSSGQESQFFKLQRVPQNKAVAQGSAVVLVDGVEWPQVDFIPFEASNLVAVAYAEDPVTVQTGDGRAGNIPPRGAEVRVTYRATLGVSGTATAGTITGFTSPIVASFVEIPVIVNNAASTAPGSAADSTAKTKALAPQVFSTGQRAVTDPDYQALIEAFSDGTFGAVAAGRAVVARGIEEDAETRTILSSLESQYGTIPSDLRNRLRAHWSATLSSDCKANLISVQILQRDADGVLIAATEGLANALKAFLQSKQEMTPTISVVDGSVNLFTINTEISVKVLPTYGQATVLANVKATVDAFLKSKTFGEAVRIGDVYALVEAIAGVDFSSIRFTGTFDYLGTQVNKLDNYGNAVAAAYEVFTLGVTTMIPL